MLVNIQALRAVAAFLVVFVHLGRLTELAGLPNGVTDFGNSGVDLFFVISGLIMVVTTSERSQTASHFLRHRIARIVPLYWVITVAVFALALAAPALLQSTRADPLELIKSLVFIPYQRFDGQMHPVVFVGWTLNYEMMFYAIFALGMLLPWRSLGLAFALTVLGLASLAGQVFAPHAPLPAFYTSPIMLEFGAGMVLGVLLTRDLLPAARAPALVMGVVAFVLMLAGSWLWPTIDRSIMSGIPAFFIVGSALMAERAGLAWKSGWIQLLGAASYSIYLTHFFATQAIVKLAERLDHPPPRRYRGVWACRAGAGRPGGRYGASRYRVAPDRARAPRTGRPTATPAHRRPRGRA
ncbi:MAG TPA: acyltransferase [Rhizomicrobium sp.]|nr:acyltransferase [Rhizomicrobium sp.]